MGWWAGGRLRAGRVEVLPAQSIRQLFCRGRLCRASGAVTCWADLSSLPLFSLQAAVQEARSLLTTGQPRQALGYCSLAVLAGGGSACHLRLRASCLAELQEFGRALRDLDLVLQEEAGGGDLPMRAEDLCSRGRLLLSLGDEVGATGAFTQALRLAPAPAQNSLWAQPGQAPAAQALLHQGQRCLQGQRYAEAWAAAESGLLLDPEHGGLKRLKARIRREAASGCRLH